VRPEAVCKWVGTMGGSTWVQNQIQLGIEGELLVFQRPNSPNFYMRVWIAKESKYYQKSLKTKSQYEAIERAKVEYKLLQQKVSKEEKVFTITLEEAVEGFAKSEEQRERRGVLKNSTMVRRTRYIKNIFAPHFGYDRKVNDISDKEMIAYIDMRLKKFKNKSTLIQELSIIRQFYNTYLIKNGYVFKIPEIPEVKARVGERAKREDTFNIREWEKLYVFMREWVKPQNISKTRRAVKLYGKKENTEKLMNDWEYQMEIHRRIVIRELILIAANTGLRLPSEILSLKWGDIKLKLGKFSGLYGVDKEREELIAVIKVGKENKTGARLVQGFAGKYFKRLNEYYTSALGRKPQDNEPVFMELFGRLKFSKLSREALYRIWGELMRDCGLKRIKFELYHLRHFYITQSILNGVDILLISKNCGNSISTISTHYEHIDMEQHNARLLKRRNTKKELENEVEF